MTKKIMIVDDEPDQILTLGYSLKNTGNEFEVIPAKNGEECLEKLYNSKDLPDLILLDIMMPEMSGWSVFKKIRENSKYDKIPIIFLTAKNDKITKDAGVAFGDDFIEKPYDIRDLINKINKILDKK